MTYTIQVSNHKDAGQRIPTIEAEESWLTLYDGPIASDKEAKEAVNKCANFYRHVRAFKGKNIGRLFYAVLRME